MSARGGPVPAGKIASRPYWDKYLTILTTDDAEKRKRSHLQERLRSLEVIIQLSHHCIEI